MKRMILSICILFLLFLVGCGTTIAGDHLTDAPQTASSRHTEDSSASEPAASSVGVLSSFSDPPERNEVKLQFSRPDGLTSSDCLSYCFSELPAFSSGIEAAESNQGNSIRLSFYQQLAAGFYNVVGSRVICEEADCAFVGSTLSSLTFEPYTITQESGEYLSCIPIRLMISVESDRQPPEMYIVDENLRVMHTSAPDAFEEIRCSTIDQISTEPLSEEVFLHLFAIGLHYMHDEVFVTNLYMGLCSEDGERIDSDVTLEMVLDGESVLITESDKINRILDDAGLLSIRDICTMVCTNECTNDYTSDALQMTLRKNDLSGNEDNTLTFFLAPDGTLILPDSDMRIIRTSALKQTSAVLTMLNRVYFSTDKFPFEELKELLDPSITPPS